MREQFTPTNFARFVFGQLSQLGGIVQEVRTVADDAATVLLSNGQTFTVTVTTSRPKTPRSVAGEKA